MIYDARRAAGISQAELARRLGTQRRNIIRWERNEVKPGQAWSGALAEELRISIEDILAPEVAHVGRREKPLVARQQAEIRRLRQELAELGRENEDLRRRKAS